MWTFDVWINQNKATSRQKKIKPNDRIKKKCEDTVYEIFSEKKY